MLSETHDTRTLRTKSTLKVFKVHISSFSRHLVIKGKLLNTRATRPDSDMVQGVRAFGI